MLTPEQAVTTLGDQIQVLVPAGLLGAAEAEDLLVKLDRALKRLAKGQRDPVVVQPLQNLIKKVGHGVKRGVLTAAQGQALIDMATRVIASITVS